MPSPPTRRGGTKNNGGVSGGTWTLPGTEGSTWFPGDLAIFWWFTDYNFDIDDVSGVGISDQDRYAHSSGFGYFYIGTRVLQAGDTTFDWTGTGSGYAIYGVEVWNAHDTITLYGGFSEQSVDDPDPDGITVPDDDSAVITLFGKLTTEYSTISAPSGYTIGNTDKVNVGAHILSAGVAYQTGINSGSEDPGAWSLSGSGTGDTVVVTFSIRYADAVAVDVDLEFQESLLAPASFPISLDAGIAVTPALQVTQEPTLFPLSLSVGYELQLSLQETLRETWLGAAWGITIDVGLSLQEHSPDFLPQAVPASDITLAFSLQEAPAGESWQPSLSFSINLSLFVLEPVASFPLSITYGSDIGLSLQLLVGQNFPLETQAGYEIGLSLQETKKDCSLLGVQPKVFLPSPTKFAEASRSSSSITVLGTELGPFKLNPGVDTYHRNGPQHAVHLSTVRPTIVTTGILFRIISLTGHLQPDEFHYRSPGRYLELWNDLLIQSNLVPDGDTAAIPITPIEVLDVFGQVSFLDIHTPREILP